MRGGRCGGMQWLWNWCLFSNFTGTDSFGRSYEARSCKEKFDKNGEADYEYGLGYGEFTALNTHMIQKALNKIEELENKIKVLENK